MKLSGVIEALIAAGGTVDQIAAVVRAAEAEQDAEQTVRRAKAADKKRRQRAVVSPIVPGTGRDREGQMGTDGDTPVPPEKEAPTPQEKQTPLTPETPENLSVFAPKGAASARGSHLAADWQPSELELADAAEAGLSLMEAQAEVSKFRDHWRSAAGQNARKRDWRATWRNWCREAVRRRGPRGSPGLDLKWAQTA